MSIGVLASCERRAVEAAGAVDAKERAHKLLGNAQNAFPQLPQPSFLLSFFKRGPITTVQGAPTPRAPDDKPERRFTGLRNRGFRSEWADKHISIDE
jgi:hypothetical protein